MPYRRTLLPCGCTFKAARILQRGQTLVASTQHTTSIVHRGQARSLYTTHIRRTGKPHDSKIQVIPFSWRPSSALAEAGPWLHTYLGTQKFGKLGYLWEGIKKYLGLPNGLPYLEVVRWKPIYLPNWRLDLGSVIPSRLAGHEQHLELTAIDVPLTGTNVAPLGSCNIALPAGRALMEALEPYDPDTHARVFKDDKLAEGEAVPDAVPIAFTLLPKNLPNLLKQSLSSLWEDDIRFIDEVQTTLFAAYPFYAPFYLIDFKDSNHEGGDRTITTLMYGQGRWAPFVPYFSFLNPEDGQWTPARPTNFSFELKSYRKNRPISPSASARSSSFKSMSPMESARAAASANSFQGSGFGEGEEHDANGRLSYRRVQELTAQAGELVRQSFVKVMAQVVESARDSGLSSNASFEQVQREMDKEAGYLSYKEYSGPNRQYLNKFGDMRTAQEAVDHARAMPSIPENATAKVLTMDRNNKFKISFKSLNHAELEATKKTMITQAQLRLSQAVKDAEDARPQWLALQQEKEHRQP